MVIKQHDPLILSFDDGDDLCNYITAFEQTSAGSGLLLLLLSLIQQKLFILYKS